MDPNHPNETSVDVSRRFGGINRLYGPSATQTFAHAHVVVVGVGGVGSWVVEALARSGVGTLTLIDLDHIAESNINRQIHALDGTLGQSKITAMAARIHQINPRCQTVCHDTFLDADNVQMLLDPSLDIVIDCTDHVNAKIAMILTCRARALPLIVCGAAGGKTDPLSLRQGDLRDATHDALLARIRNRLRKEQGYPRTHAKRTPKMGVQVLWFEQPTVMPAAWSEPTPHPTDQPDPSPGSPLACAGYGSGVTLTATLGFAAANMAINQLLAGKQTARSTALVRTDTP